MKKVFCFIFLLLTYICLSNSLHAEEDKILTTTIETGLNSNARSAGSSNNEVIFTQDWFFGIALPSNFDIELYAGGTKQIEGSSQDGTLNDSYAQLQQKLYSSDFFKFNLSARYIAPTSENSAHNTHMRWGMQIRPTLLFNLYKGDFLKIVS